MIITTAMITSTSQPPAAIVAPIFSTAATAFVTAAIGDKRVDLLNNLAMAP